VLSRAPSLVLALPDGPAWIAVRRTAREYGALSGVSRHPAIPAVAGRTINCALFGLRHGKHRHV
jgi:hypothetical protein